ncbi:hypothetical protein Droror1_Dr00023051 [Drosera rotundifolia]
MFNICMCNILILALTEVVKLNSHIPFSVAPLGRSKTAADEPNDCKENHARQGIRCTTLHTRDGLGQRAYSNQGRVGRRWRVPRIELPETNSHGKDEGHRWLCR